MNEEILLNAENSEERKNIFVEETSPVGKQTTNRFSKWVSDFSPKKMFHHENFIHALPFIFFVSALAMIYISNSYYAEKTIREIDKANNDLKEMRSEYISTKSDLMLMSKQSQVARTVANMGLKESVVPPKKIVEKAKEQK